MKVLKGNGYIKYKVPQTSSADHLFQKEIFVGFLDKSLALNAYVYDPRDYKPDRTVEFQFQLDREGCPSVRTKIFGISDEELGHRQLEEIEDKAKNIFAYLHYA